MNIRVGRARRSIPVWLGVVTLAGVVGLLLWDAAPARFPASSHEFLATFCLAMIAVAYIAHQIAMRPVPMEWAKAILLAAAFLFWAANQFWPNLPEATLFNDIAIGLFVFDIFLVIVGWPGGASGGALARNGDRSRREKRI